MALSNERKAEIVGGYQRGAKDTGSPEVQVALLTQRIAHLTEHLKVHRKDFASRRGLLKMVGRRQTLLNYLKRTQYPRYMEIKKRLELRHS